MRNFNRNRVPGFVRIVIQTDESRCGGVLPRYLGHSEIIALHDQFMIYSKMRMYNYAIMCKYIIVGNI